MSSELKKELCKRLLDGGQLKLYDVIRHSYTKNRLNNGDKNMNRVESVENNICPTLDTRSDCLGVVVENLGQTLKSPKPIKLGHIPYPNSDKAHQSNTFYSVEGVCPTVDTCGGGNREPKIAEPLVWDGYNQQVRADSSVVGTLTRQCGADLKCNGQGITESPYRIRKLTPKECLRLMGVKDEDIDKMSKNQSNSSLYHLAGDSIVVDVLMAIFNQML